MLRDALLNIGLTIYQEQAMTSQSSKEKKRVKTLVIATLIKSFNLPNNREVSLDKIDQVLQLKVPDPKKHFNSSWQTESKEDRENRRKKYDSNTVTLTFDEQGGTGW
ncbi:hypothetical protein ACFE04_019124 [Oxalis oulophora]